MNKTGGKQNKRNVFLLIGIAALIALGAILFFVLRGGGPAEDYTLELDGKRAEAPLTVEKPGEELRVIVTLDGKEIASLPFGEDHNLRIRQGNGDENLVRITEEAVLMESANCEGQDCVHMEKVTRENMETRVMFGMIICLPHKVSVEVR